jgi:heat shock protein HtpX
MAPAPAFGLYGHIRANRIRSMLLLGGLFLLVYAIVFAGSLGYHAFTRPNLPLQALMRLALYDLGRAAPFVTIGVALWVYVAYWFNASIIDAMTGSEPLDRRDNPRLYDQLEVMCISVGMPMPHLKIMETDAVNAFASGLRQDQYAITMTRGLLNQLDSDEIEAVMGHELTHIRNGDVRLMVIAIIIAGVVSFVGEMIFRWFTDGSRLARSGRWSSGDSSSSNSSSASSDGSSDSDSGKAAGGAFAAILIAVAIIALAWALSLVIRFALSRSREYLADAGAVELTKNPDAMISALLKISGRGELPNVPSGIMEMCVDNPRAGFADLFATHPPIEARVQALMTSAGGRLPDWANDDGQPAPDAITQSARDDQADPLVYAPDGIETAGQAQAGSQAQAGPNPGQISDGLASPWGKRR